MRWLKGSAFVWIVAFFLSCAPAPKVRVEPPTQEQLTQAREANALLAKGSYLALKQASRIYDSLSAHPQLRKALAERSLRTCLLLGVREKELGIVNLDTLDKAEALLRQNPSLEGYRPLYILALSLWFKGRGIMGDVDIRLKDPEAERPLWDSLDELKGRARVDPYTAYLLATHQCFYGGARGVPQIGVDLNEYVTLFPDSTLILFKKATCDLEDPDLLRQVLARDPSFSEVHYYLGNVALSRGFLLEAEGHYQQAYKDIPESPQITITLASIAFAAEEFERSIEFYDRTLLLTPDYREALLGKAISLSYLGRNQEAIVILQDLVNRGLWLMGESHFWLAWNQHELKDDAAAAENVEQAKGRLPTNTEVFSLAGVIALYRGDVEAAQKNFFEALQFNPSNDEALYHLGSLYARTQEWEKSGTYFEKAAQVFEAKEQSLLDKLEEVRTSSLPEERKQKLILRREAQVAKTRLTAATSSYNAAAGYFNAGLYAKASASCGKAIAHPALRSAAGELAQKIQSKL